MTMSLKKALRANRWMEEMINEFKRAYIRKYQILQRYTVCYPDEKMSDEDEFEEGGLANLVGPSRRDARKAATEMVARTSGSKGGGGKRSVTQKVKGSEKGADGSAWGRTTKKKGDKKTSPPDPSGEKKKKTVKHKKDQGGEPGSTASEPPPEKKLKKERKKKKKKETEADSAEPAPKKKMTKGTPSATLGRAPDAEAPLMQEASQEAAPVSVEQRSNEVDEQLEAHLLGADPQLQWPSQSRPCPVQWHPQTWSWEVS